MTAHEYYDLFSQAMNEKTIINCENENSRDDYHTYAIRKTQSGYLFFCLIETFFRTGRNLDSWIAGSIKSFHEFKVVKGSTKHTLLFTERTFSVIPDYKKDLPAVLPGESNWITID